VTPGAERVVAAFDFDKTLSTRENVAPFFRLVAGRVDAARVLASVAPLLLTGRREAAKVAACRRLFRGRSADDVRAVGARYAAEICERHLRDDVLDRLNWHRAQGHEVVLVSASLDVYLDEVGRLLGVTEVMATALEVGGDGRLTGRLTGANVRGKEKARRLDQWLGGTPALVWAYGDSAGDRELLARADRPVRIGRSRLEIPKS